MAGQGFGAALRGGVYDHIQGYAFSNIEKFTTASLVTRLTSDVNTLQMTLLMGMRFLIRSPVMLLAALVLALQISRQLSQVFLLAIPLLLLAAVLLLTRASPLFRALQEKTDALNLTVQESLLGIRVVKSFAREDHEQEKFQKRNEALRRTSERAFGLVVLNMPIMMLIVYGGQKQRLCIARAILKQPKVLILDDSTSAVDMDTDAKIRRALRDELQSTTKIVIAQRVRSVMEADLILVLEEGRLVAQGDHETLLETCDIYREIYTSQQEGGSIRE